MGRLQGRRTDEGEREAERIKARARSKESNSLDRKEEEAYARLKALYHLLHHSAGNDKGARSEARKGEEAEFARLKEIYPRFEQRLQDDKDRRWVALVESAAKLGLTLSDLEAEAKRMKRMKRGE